MPSALSSSCVPNTQRTSCTQATVRKKYAPRDILLLLCSPCAYQVRALAHAVDAMYKQLALDGVVVHHDAAVPRHRVTTHKAHRQGSQASSPQRWSACAAALQQPYNTSSQVTTAVQQRRWSPRGIGAAFSIPRCRLWTPCPAMAHHQHARMKKQARADTGQLPSPRPLRYTAHEARNGRNSRGEGGGKAGVTAPC